MALFVYVLVFIGFLSNAMLAREWKILVWGLFGFTLKRLENSVLLPPWTLHRSWEKLTVPEGIIHMGMESDVTG